MKILVVSDTHGRWGRLHDVLAVQSSADVVIHLGDGESDLENVRFVYPDRQMLFVAGNCDFGSRCATVGFAELAGKRIFYTHGHFYGVKYGTERLIAAAKEQKADICLYGHTHIVQNDYIDGMYIMNPGSLGQPSDGTPTYGLIELSEAGIMTNIVRAAF